MMEIPYELPLDDDGFLRRECPHCEQEFKWHHGKMDDAPADFVDPDIYWCPLCGSSAVPSSWWTQPQVEYQQAVMVASSNDIIGEALKDSFKPRSGGAIKFQVTQGSSPSMPDPLVEPNDMAMIAPPCHPWEPVKVANDAHPPFYCLLCGEAYAV